MKLVFPATLVAALALAMPAVASAEIRQGTATDPTADSAGAPSQDIVSATGQYDSNGSFRVSATMNGDIASGPNSQVSFRIASFAAPAQCTGNGISAFGSSNQGNGLFIQSNTSGLGDAFRTVNGSTITFSGSDRLLAGKDYTCMTLTVSKMRDAAGNGGGLADQLDVPVFFVGFGPDTDGDGVKDNQDNCVNEAGPAPTGCAPDTDGDGVKDNTDQCPGAVGPAPSGCPAASTTPPATTTTQPPVAVTPGTSPTPTTVKKCSPPSLKGKTLAAAKKALTKAGCKLGKVTKPKKVKKGFRLVVTKQKKSGTTVNVTLGPTRIKTRSFQM